MDIPQAGEAIGFLNDLPAGHYIITAKAQFNLADDQGSTTIECTLLVTDLASQAGPFTDLAGVTLPGPQATPGTAVATLPLLAAADLPSGGNAVLTCGQVLTSHVAATNVKLTAIQIGSLIMQ